MTDTECMSQHSFLKFLQVWKGDIRIPIEAVKEFLPLINLQSKDLVEGTFDVPLSVIFLLVTDAMSPPAHD